MPWISKAAPHQQGLQMATQKTAWTRASPNQNWLWGCKECAITCIPLREWQKYGHIIKRRNHPKYTNQIRKQITWAPQERGNYPDYSPLTQDSLSHLTNPLHKKTNINCFNYKFISDSLAKKFQSFFPEQLDWNKQLEKNGLLEQVEIDNPVNHTS